MGDLVLTLRNSLGWKHSVMYHAQHNLLSLFHLHVTFELIR